MECPHENPLCNCRCKPNIVPNISQTIERLQTAKEYRLMAKLLNSCRILPGSYIELQINDSQSAIPA